MHEIHTKPHSFIIFFSRMENIPVVHFEMHELRLGTIKKTLICHSERDFDMQNIYHIYTCKNFHSVSRPAPCKTRVLCDFVVSQLL